MAREPIEGAQKRRNALGGNIRQLRAARNLTARQLAEWTGVSPSLISKIESGASNPSIDVLRKIATALHVALGDLMDPHPDPQPASQSRHGPGYVAVVRAGERKLLRVPRSGIEFQLLTPDVQGQAEFVWIESAPGEGGLQPFAHERGEESVLVLEGELTVYIDGKPYVVCRGDCLTFDATLPHLYRNEDGEKCIWLYLAVPPTL